MTDQVKPPSQASWHRRLQRLAVRWGGLVVVAAVLAIVSFGGSLIYEQPDAAGVYEEWQHGWPYPFLQRAVIGEPSHRLEWWRGRVVGGLIQWQSFIADTALLIGMLAVLFGGPWLFRKRDPSPRAPTFSLNALLVVMTLICLFLGSLAWSLTSARAERNAGARLRAAGHQVELAYRGPLWLTRIWGSNEPPLALQGVSRLALTNHITDEDLRSLRNDLRQFSRIESLSIFDSPVTDDGLVFLAEQGTLAHAEEVALSNVKVTPRCLRLLEQVDSLRSFTSEGTSIREKDCVTLQKRGVDCQVFP